MPIQGSYESHYAAALDMYKPCRNRSNCAIQEICYIWRSNVYTMEPMYVLLDRSTLRLQPVNFQYQSIEREVAYVQQYPPSPTLPTSPPPRKEKKTFFSSRGGEDTTTHKLAEREGVK